MQDLTWDQICRRAGGRRRYNAWRQFKQAYRRHLLAALLVNGVAGWGDQVRWAAHFGVSEATISRDLAALQAEWRARYGAH